MRSLAKVKLWCHFVLGVAVVAPVSALAGSAPDFEMQGLWKTANAKWPLTLDVLRQESGKTYAMLQLPRNKGTSTFVASGRAQDGFVELNIYGLESSTDPLAGSLVKMGRLTALVGRCSASASMFVDADRELGLTLSGEYHDDGSDVRSNEIGPSSDAKGEGSGKESKAKGEGSGKESKAKGEGSGKESKAKGEGSGKESKAKGEGSGKAIDTESNGNRNRKALNRSSDRARWYADPYVHAAIDSSKGASDGSRGSRTDKQATHSAPVDARDDKLAYADSFVLRRVGGTKCH